MKEKKNMADEKLIIEGYQPTADGYQPTANARQTGQSASANPAAEMQVVPPRGGTGETVLKKG
jgi:hypothetical protein